MTNFNRRLMDVARQVFPIVYVDTISETGFRGSQTAYKGDRVRIYPTGWEYEEPLLFLTNEEFEEYMTEWLATEIVSGMTYADVI